MAQEYVDKLTELIDGVKPKLPRGKAIEVKHFFGGAAGYVDGRIGMSLTKVGFALKLPDDTRSHLLKSRRAKELRYFPGAPIKKQYALMSKKISKDVKLLKPWMDKSIAFVLSSKSTR